MKILYISTFVNEETVRYLRASKDSDCGISYAVIKYVDMIRRGLEDNVGDNLKVIFSPAISSYKASKLFYYKPIITSSSPKGIYLNCINYIIIKQISLAIKILFYTLVWFFGNINTKKKVIVLSSIQPPFQLAMLFLKFFNVKIVSFIPDLPEFQYEYSPLKGNTERILLPFYKLFSKVSSSAISIYIFITKDMVNKFPRKPYMIMEGLVDNNIKIEPREKCKVFSVMYAGTLHETMGIKLLLEAIERINNQNIEFYFFGRGDMATEIEIRSKTDKRIKFMGFQPNELILEYEKKVQLLINPRQSENEYTKYSFPSKLMEYMLSGTPVLTTRLKGIPDDYSDKMFYIDSETPQGIRKAIEECYSHTDSELVAFGLKAQMYVMNEKNYKKQIEKLMTFLESYN